MAYVPPHCATSIPSGLPYCEDSALAALQAAFRFQTYFPQLNILLFLSAKIAQYHAFRKTFSAKRV
jgi:hypothetical protein